MTSVSHFPFWATASPSVKGQWEPISQAPAPQHLEFVGPETNLRVTCVSGCICVCLPHISPSATGPSFALGHSGVGSAEESEGGRKEEEERVGRRRMGGLCALPHPILPSRHKSRTCRAAPFPAVSRGSGWFQLMPPPLQGAPWSPGREESWVAGGELFTP